MRNINTVSKSCQNESLQNIVIIIKETKEKSTVRLDSHLKHVRMRLIYVQKPYCDKKNIYKKANQPDFSFPFYLNFDFDINIDTIIKLEKEKFGKGYSILYLIPNWKKIIDSYFDIFSINLKANDFIEFNKYVKNNGRQNLLALNIDKF